MPYVNLSPYFFTAEDAKEAGEEHEFMSKKSGTSMHLLSIRRPQPTIIIYSLCVLCVLCG